MFEEGLQTMNRPGKAFLPTDVIYEFLWSISKSHRALLLIWLVWVLWPHQGSIFLHSYIRWWPIWRTLTSSIETLETLSFSEKMENDEPPWQISNHSSLSTIILFLCGVKGKITKSGETNQSSLNRNRKHTWAQKHRILHNLWKNYSSKTVVSFSLFKMNFICYNKYFSPLEQKHPSLR